MLTLVETAEKITGMGNAKIISVTEVKLLKKHRSTKDLVPPHLEGLQKVTMQVVRIGDDYTARVNNSIKKNGIVGAQYPTVPSKISLPDSPNGVVRKGIKNAAQKYIRTFIVDGQVNKNMEVIYINSKNQVIVPSRDEKDGFFPKSYGCVKQAIHGVSKEIKVREYKSQSIKYLQKGNLICNTLEPWLMKLLDLEETEE